MPSVTLPKEVSEYCEQHGCVVVSYSQMRQIILALRELRDLDTDERFNGDNAAFQYGRLLAGQTLESLDLGGQIIPLSSRATTMRTF